VNALLALEPREAGTAVLEPVIAFDDGFYAEQDRTRCPGCCFSHTQVDVATQSQTG
jgi:hypothetical protein